MAKAVSADRVAFEMDTLHISRDSKITHVSVVAALKEAHLGKDVVQHRLSSAILGNRLPTHRKTGCRETAQLPPVAH